MQNETMRHVECSYEDDWIDLGNGNAIPLSGHVIVRPDTEERILIGVPIGHDPDCHDCEQGLIFKYETDAFGFEKPFPRVWVCKCTLPSHVTISERQTESTISEDFQF